MKSAIIATLLAVGLTGGCDCPPDNDCPAVGNYLQGKGNYAKGKYNLLKGDCNDAIGFGNTGLGEGNFLQGKQNFACGKGNKAVGVKNRLYGLKNYALGSNNCAEGAYNSVIGEGNVVECCDEDCFNIPTPPPPKLPCCTKRLCAPEGSIGCDNYKNCLGYKCNGAYGYQNNCGCY